jgi:hypothetical protein
LVLSANGFQAREIDRLGCADGGNPDPTPI